VCCECEDEVDGKPERGNLRESVAVRVVGERRNQDHQSKALDQYNPCDVQDAGKQKPWCEIEGPRTLALIVGEDDAQGSARCKVGKLVWGSDTPIDEDSERRSQDCQESGKDHYLEVVAAGNGIAMMNTGSTDSKLKHGKESDKKTGEKGRHYTLVKSLPTLDSLDPHEHSKVSTDHWSNMGLYATLRIKLKPARREMGSIPYKSTDERLGDYKGETQRE